MADITTLKGIGEKTSLLYRKIGIDNVEDLYEYYPRDYIEYTDYEEHIDSALQTVISFKAVVSSKVLNKKIKNLTITSCKVNSGGVMIKCTWFHMPYLNKQLITGGIYVFRGVVEKKKDSYYIQQPVIYKVDEYELKKNTYGPVYSLTKGLSNNAISKSVKNAFDLINDNSSDKYNMHFPKNLESLIRARKNLVYEEFLLFILHIRKLREDNQRRVNDFNIIEVSQCERIIESLPYRLTNAQSKVWEEIRTDLTKSSSMARLVQGDVGSGKTILAFLAAIMCGINGYQSAIMAPTEILATQHFEALSSLLNKNNIDMEIRLLTGSVSAANKRRIKEELKDGKITIVIGTHALIQKDVEFNNLALVITDEQHRFGVSQRENLAGRSEGRKPHVLVMSATPIPRTMAIIIYGDLDISVIDELPNIRLPIKNCVVNTGYRKKAYDFIKDEVNKGHQAYVICPMVEESEGINAQDVVSYTQKLKAYYGDYPRVECLHGKMKPIVKQDIMGAFAKGDIDILVSTTVIEVGINVVNATVMMVEDANRFGLAQLHQLRGRIGRGDAQSYCIFISSDSNERSMERLNILNTSNDGFYIASCDMKMRGPGDVLGIRQSGDMEFKLADIYTDADVLKKAVEDADEILREDPELLSKKYKVLKEKLEKFESEEILYSI